jgi:signal transduction histidine kinase
MSCFVKNHLSILFFLLCCWATVHAQQPDSTKKPTPTNLNPFILPGDTSDFLDKYIISELEKVQYAKYSEDLKKQTLQKLLENQKLQNVSLQQKLLNQQIKVESDRKQAEAERKAIQAKEEQAAQKQKIRQLKVKELNQRLQLENRTRNFLLIGVLLLTLLGISLLWSNQQLKKRNRSIQQLSAENLIKELEKQQILTSQNETLEQQVNERTLELNKSLTDLKATQAQLIQSEKLASLGELTAGIAHEIQNPLNFVNNFAELSVELAEELKEEINKPKLDKGLIEELVSDLALNQEKINHHGQRASSIVKGMLEHSRGRDAINRVSTDINALADEYLRLAYHGLRAKDSSFNAAMETHFDPALPKIEVIPQDIGRVLLNLINNAFYAVAERSRSTVNEKAKQGLEGYSPTVSISSRKLGDTLEISVKDNGNGIPETIKDKIFQPFFTTKPTGQGTGLGLSLAYDIVTKGHGGTLEVESKDGIGSTFIIALPMGTF